MKDIESIARDFALRLKRDFARDISRDPAEFKKRVLQSVRRELPPKRGRPPDPQLDAAARLVDEGKPIRDVVRWLVPGYDQMDTVGRYLTAKGLRAALARRRKQRRPVTAQSN